MRKEFEVVIDEDNAGKRLDVVLSEVTGVTRSNLKNHMEALTVNGKAGKLSYKGRIGDTATVALKWEEQTFIPEDIPLDVVYEDDNYLVINKAQGMVVHPAKGNYTGTLVHALWGRYNYEVEDGKDASELSLEDLRLKAGIVHRLDKDTSGLMIIAKRMESLQYLSSLFKDHKIKKIYSAVLKGKVFPFHQHVINNIGRHPRQRTKMAVVEKGGKHSHSIFHVVRHVGNYTYVKVRIKTGRTHQIRVHASNLGYPILGDPIYSRHDSGYPNIGLCLAATKLSFYDKFSDRELTFKIRPPKGLLIHTTRESKGSK